MSLPPALAARLAKRGIISQDYVQTQEKKFRSDAEEEVIAENYDSNVKGSKNSDEDGFEISSAQADKHFKGHSGCPNKWNVYHECNSFCVKVWGKRFITPDSKYLRKQVSLLSKYPLPPGWKQVYDPGTGRHYYWQVTSDMVSWLPPTHPKAVISESAATIREERHLAATDKDSDRDSESEEDDEEVPGVRDEDFDTNRDGDVIKEREKKRRDSKAKSKYNELDPMDPASYSDIPRGKWSDGLDRSNEAKTGADVTAPGPLFQMRPYPNPGAVLRANAAVDRLPPA